MNKYIAHHEGGDHDETETINEPTVETTSVQEQQPEAEFTTTSVQMTDDSATHSEFSAMPIIIGASAAVVVGLVITVAALQKVGKKGKK